MPSLNHFPLPRRVRPGWRCLGAVLLLPLAVACHGDHLIPTPPTDPAMLYWSLELNHHAVTLSTTAPYDTLTLTATPRNAAGEALAGLPSPQYRSVDPERVVVTADGGLVGFKETNNPIPVIATLITANLKHEDTVFVRVVDAPTPPMLGTLSIQPVPPDSAKFAMNGGPHLLFEYLLNHLVRATDAGGMPLATTSVGFDPLRDAMDAYGFALHQFSVADLLVSFRSSDTTIAEIHSENIGNGMRIYKLMGRRPGTVMLYASATVFGVTKADTLPFRIGLPVMSMAFISTDGIQPRTVTVGAGALVLWYFFNADITFSDPTHVAAGMTAASFLPSVDEGICLLLSSPCDVAGNIPTTAFSYLDVGGSQQSRVFPVPGIYPYQSTPAAAGGTTFTGKIVVVDER